MLDATTDLRSILKDPSLVPNKAYVAGEWVTASDGATFPVINPARGDVIALVPNLTRADAGLITGKVAPSLAVTHSPAT